MHVDLNNYPKDYTFCQIMSREIGQFVKVADFTEWKGHKFFRIIMDPEVSYKVMKQLMDLTVSKGKLTYGFHNVEAIQGPVVDSVNHRTQVTPYLRFTFVGEDIG